jgi:hypothetical protein
MSKNSVLVDLLDEVVDGVVERGGRSALGVAAAVGVPAAWALAAAVAV